MGIKDDFLGKEGWIADRAKRKNRSEAYKLWRNRVLSFLDFCGQRKVFLISDIKTKDYGDFIRKISKDRSARTVSDWKYALKEFFERARLSINVRTPPKKQFEKRLGKIRARLLTKYDEKTSKDILQMIEGFL